MYVVGVMAARAQAHAPCAGVAEATGVARPERIAAPAEPREMALHGIAEGGKERLQRRAAHLARIQWQLTTAAHRLLERVRAIAMEGTEIGGQLGEKRGERAPAFGRFEPLGGDERCIVVQRVI